MVESTRWARWRRLSWQERLFVAQAAVMLLVAYLVSSCTWLRPAVSCGRSTLSGDTVRDDAQRTARLVALASAGLGLEGPCLRRSIVLWWLLRRQGIESCVRLGVPVGGREDAFSAHAWVECGGRALLEASDPAGRFRVFEPALVPVLGWRGSGRNKSMSSGRSAQ